MLLAISIIKVFHNLPGKCNFALITSLLIADGSFLLAGILFNTSFANIKVLCASISILIHFGLTTSHMMSCQHILTNAHPRKFRIYNAVTILYSVLL